MRFSAWSLRVISVCSALVFAPSAWAHLSVSPTRVSVGEAVDLTFSAPNEDDAVGDRPRDAARAAGVRPRRRRGKAGLDAVARRRRDHLERRPDPEAASTRRSRSAEPRPKTPGTVTFNVLVGDRTGKSITYRVGLDVAKSTTRDNGARTLGKAALARRARRRRCSPWRRSSSGSTSGSGHLRPRDALSSPGRARLPAVRRRRPRVRLVPGRRPRRRRRGCRRPGARDRAVHRRRGRGTAFGSSASSRRTPTPTTSPGTAGSRSSTACRSRSTRSPSPSTHTSHSPTATSCAQARPRSASCTHRAIGPSTARSSSTASSC